MTTIGPLVAALVDDAGLFPPERLPMDRAVARHRADTAAGHPVLTHRFLCPASRLDELRATLGADEALRVGLIVDGGPADVDAAASNAAGDARLRLETVEVALPETDPAAAARAHAPDLIAVGARVFVEVPRARGWEDALNLIASAGLGAKLRCGGVRAALFPTTDQLATMLVAIVARGLAWKATAGLHHAVRHRDAVAGFDHHGFLNLLVAVGHAVDGGSRRDVASVLALEDGPSLVAEVRAMALATVRRARRSLVAYGSCSTSEPIADLQALGLLDDGTTR